MSNKTFLKRLFINFSLLVITSLSCIIVLEGFLFFLLKKESSIKQGRNWAENVAENKWILYDPEVGWVNEPFKQVLLQKDALKAQITINDNGTRKQNALNPSNNEKPTKIDFVGDSFTFGFGVDDSETFSNLLEINNPKFTTRNLGVAGYGIDQILIHYQNFLRINEQPDFVFLVIYPEDFWRALRAYTDAGHGKPYYQISSKNNLILKNQPAPKQRSELATMPQFPGIYEQKDLFTRLYHKSEFLKILRKIYTRIRKNVGILDPDSSDEWILGEKILKLHLNKIKDKGIKIIIVLAPPMRWILGTDEPIRESLKRFSTRESFDFIDPTDALRQGSQNTNIYDYYLKKDLHWTAKGHFLLYRLIEDHLSEQYKS